MSKNIISANEVRAALGPLTLKQLEELDALSGVPFTTLYKIKRGETPNPGIETVGRFFHLIQSVTEGTPPPFQIGVKATVGRSNGVMRKAPKGAKRKPARKLARAA